MTWLDSLLERLRRAAGRSLPPHLRDARSGEDLAYRHLRCNGYTVVARNFRARHGRGELDLVGWDGEHLAVVEVKTRRSAEWGHPAEAVGQEKRRQLIRAGLEFARRSGVSPERLRFDIASVILEPEPQVELWKAAFSLRSNRRPRGSFPT